MAVNLTSESLESEGNFYRVQTTVEKMREEILNINMPALIFSTIATVRFIPALEFSFSGEGEGEYKCRFHSDYLLKNNFLE